MQDFLNTLLERRTSCRGSHIDGTAVPDVLLLQFHFRLHLRIVPAMGISRHWNRKCKCTKQRHYQPFFFMRPNQHHLLTTPPVPNPKMTLPILQQIKDDFNQKKKAARISLVKSAYIYSKEEEST